jgi:alpha-tubulin suppressor-like RCC1 family protein
LLDKNTDDKLEWIQIECGNYHTVGLTKRGEVFSWGLNYSGQGGHGDKLDKRVPTKVESLDGLVITKISCGAFHTAALTDQGEILTWYVPS